METIMKLRMEPAYRDYIHVYDLAEYTYQGI